MTIFDTRTGEVIEPMTEADHLSLEQHEEIIERGLKTFVEVGQALAEIRDSRLYRETHGTFEAYCEQRWNMSRSLAYDTIAAASTATALSAIADTPAPANIGQARELKGLPAQAAADTMRTAHAATGGKVTAKDIREAVGAHIEKQAVEDVEEFPALTHYAERGRSADVVRLAGSLRQFEPEERERRLEILGKTIAAEVRNERGEEHPVLTVVPDESPDYDAALAELRAIAARLNAMPVPAAELSHAVSLMDWEIRSACDYLVTFISETPEDARHAEL